MASIKPGGQQQWEVAGRKPSIPLPEVKGGGRALTSKADKMLKEAWEEGSPGKSAVGLVKIQVSTACCIALDCTPD